MIELMQSFVICGYDPSAWFQFSSNRTVGVKAKLFRFFGCLNGHHDVRDNQDGLSRVFHDVLRPRHLHERFT